MYKINYSTKLSGMATVIKTLRLNTLYWKQIVSYYINEKLFYNMHKNHQMGTTKKKLNT